MSAPGLLLPAIILIPLLAGLLALGVGRRLGRATGVLMLAAALGSLALSLLALDTALRDAPIELVRPWIPSLDIALALRGDGFGLFFAVLVSGIGALVGLYALTYLPPLAPARLGRFWAALTGFMAAMLGIALADDLMLLFVFWEITSITSFVLIGFWYEEDGARRGALTALLVTALGGLAMLAGFVLLGIITGTYRLSEIAAPGLQATLTASPLLLPALLLVLGGAFTKSAQVPFHFWLPGAMVAPTPVSTYLHAATMVKAGVFLAGRMLPVFGTMAAWAPILGAFGLATFALGAYRAFRETDLKAILAQTTVSTLGLVMMLYGLGAADQDVLQLLSHAAYKGALFLCAGIVEHAVHTRDLRRLGGLRHRLPVTFVVAGGAALSMAGLPPFMGFLAKEALYAELLTNALLVSRPLLQGAVIAIAVVSNAFVFGVAMKLLIGIFLGPAPTPHGAPDGSHDGDGESAGLWTSPLVLAAIALALGVLGLTPLTERTVNALSSDPHAHLHVALVPHAPGPVLLSLVTVALGLVLYRARGTVGRLQARIELLPAMQRVWDGVLAGVTAFAVGWSRRWQSGSLRWYLSGTLVFFVALSALALDRGGLALANVTIALGELPWYAVALATLLVAAAVAVVRARTRLAAALALTAVGFLVALVFVVYRSPDILLTQILIETVATIFILLVLYFMPAFRRDRLTAGQTLWITAVSGAVGGLMFVLVLLVTSPTFRVTANLAQDYLSRALPDAGGRNAVNVIIVDFRAIDTTGEITVLVVVALCIFGLLRARREAT